MEKSSLKDLKIMPRKLNEILRSWIRLLYVPVALKYISKLTFAAEQMIEKAIRKVLLLLLGRTYHHAILMGLDSLLLHLIFTFKK
jgi:hypothetical protein